MNLILLFSVLVWQIWKQDFMYENFDMGANNRIYGFLKQENFEHVWVLDASDMRNNLSPNSF